MHPKCTSFPKMYDTCGLKCKLTLQYRHLLKGWGSRPWNATVVGGLGAVLEGVLEGSWRVLEGDLGDVLEGVLEGNLEVFK